MLFYSHTHLLSSPSDSATLLLSYSSTYPSTTLPYPPLPSPSVALHCPPLLQPLVRIPGGGQLFSMAASLLRSTMLGSPLRDLTRFLLPYVRPVVTTIPFYLCGVEFEPLFYRCVTGEGKRREQRSERSDMNVGTHETPPTMIVAASVVCR